MSTPNLKGNTYKLVEIVGSSTESNADAIKNGIVDAAKTIKNIEWYEVIEQRGHVENGKVAHFQVTLKVGFRVDI